MTTAYLILLTLFLVAGIKLSRIKINNAFQNVLSPRLILVISYYMYSAAMPISRLFFASKEMHCDIEYMKAQILGGLGILIGLYFQKYCLRFMKKKSSKQVSQIYLPIFAIIIMTIAVGIIMFCGLKALGWNLSAIFTTTRYYETSLKTGNQAPTLFGAILWLCAISGTVLAFVGAYSIKNSKLILLTLLCAGLFCIFFLLRGARLYAGAMALSIICVYFYSKPINIKKILLSCLCLYFIIYMVGIVRELPIAQMANASITIQKFDPGSQEFGVNYRVFEIWSEMWQNKPLLLGKSYTIDLFSHMVPRIFWLDRPNTMAVQFSMDYFGVSNANELTMAFGFSPIVEALINFGFMGIVPVFAFFSFLIVLLESWFMRKGAWGIACYAFMIPTVIFWNRMDMAMTVKIFIIYLVVSKIFASVMYGKRLTIKN